jgi:hypothetical protein
MVAVRYALCAACLGGCLIVRATDDRVPDPCPNSEPELLADANGAFVITDAIYFTGANGTLSRIELDGGPVTELTLDNTLATVLGADADYIYHTQRSDIVRRRFDGHDATTIASGFVSVTDIIVDDTSIVWSSTTGVDRWSKADGTIEHLDDGSLIAGLGAYGGKYYYSSTHNEAVRRAPPVEDLTTARYPGPLLVDDTGVTFYQVGEEFVDYAGTIDRVPHDGGALTTIARDLLPVTALVADATDLYFATGYAGLYRIQRVSRLGGDVTALACRPFQQQRIRIAVAGAYIYWTDGASLYRLPKP